MNTRPYQRFYLGSLTLLAALFASAGWAANEALSLVINSAPPGGTTTAQVKILNPGDVESFSLKLTFASGGILSLPATNWFTRGSYFPSNPFGPAPTVDLNHYDDSGARTRVYMDGFKPAGATGEIGAVALQVAAGAVNGDSQVVSLSGVFWSRAEQTVKTLLPVDQEFVVGQPPTNTADLSVTKSDAPDPVMAGGQLVYTITVHNAGPDPAENVVATDNLPAGVTLLSTSGCAESPAGGAPTCSLGTIAAGASKPYTITVTVGAQTTGPLTNQVSVAATTPEANPGNESASATTTVTTSTNPVLQINLVNPGQGQVISQDGKINCGADCTETYPAGTTVTLTATPAAGFLLAGWSGGCTDDGPPLATTTVLLNASQTCTVTFAEEMAELEAGVLCGTVGEKVTLPVRLLKHGDLVASTGFTLALPAAPVLCDAETQPTVSCSSAVKTLGFSCTGQVDCAASSVQVLVAPPLQVPVPQLPEGDIVQIVLGLDPSAEAGDAALCSTEPDECLPVIFTAHECGDTSGQTIPCLPRQGCLDALACGPGDCNGDGKLTSADVTCMILRIFNAIAQVSACEDCNGDGKLTSADVTCGILCIFGQCPPKP